MKPPRLCHCGQTVPAGERCQCQRKQDRERNRRHDQNRLNSRDRGYDRDWEELRRYFLGKYPHCRMCAAMGKTTPATVADHIIPIRLAPDRRLDPSNLQPLCAFHHNSVKQKQERSR
ncbi:HNH endonuclease [Rhizobium sp. TRM95796]|uniref:HNH endonuclease n=1 Tax=Rhizobium sp. TRM95796 TaxID=2979862 RepID=UPI0021E8D1E5|nr:HNH endonuclease signature motif containing protein [Rhizobium sp. TRM95796]MCV3766478.1 HNH endonuclease [Rhizobium sp. TRM95796]